MKDNTQEKNLIEKNENNIFGKIKNFFRKIFGKKEDTLKSDKEEIRENKQISIKSSYVIAIIQLLLFLIFSKLLLSIISNNSYNNVAINLLYLFIVETIIETLHYPFEGYLLALKEVKYVTIVNLTGVLVIRIIFALIFMKLGLGIYGIALALILDYFIRYLRYISKVKKL